MVVLKGRIGYLAERPEISVLVDFLVEKERVLEWHIATRGMGLVQKMASMRNSSSAK